MSPQAAPELKQRTGKTMVLVTHDQRIAQQCDRAVYMQDGVFVDMPTAGKA